MVFKDLEGANASAGLKPEDPGKDISIFPYSVKNGKFHKIQPGDLSIKTGARTSLEFVLGLFWALKMNSS